MKYVPFGDLFDILHCTQHSTERGALHISNKKNGKQITTWHGSTTAKLGDKKWLDSEQPGNNEPFPETNVPVYFMNNEQSGVSKQF